jgi:hypothetical protein
MPARAGFLCIAILCAAACSKPAAEADSKPARRAEDREPVIVEAGVERATVDIGDKVVYRVTVKADPAYEVDLPPVLEQFANWIIFDAGSWKSQPDVGTKKVHEISTTLDPGLGPVLSIPPTTIKYRRKGETGWREIATAPVTVEVTSVAEKPGDFREPLEHFDLPPAKAKVDAVSRAWIWWTAGAAALAAGVLAILFTRRRKLQAVAALAPHEVAQRELAHLATLGLLDRGELKEFYFRLTMILRRYIEARFAIMAPERTTEEFLVDMRKSRELTEAHRATLAAFLAAADMVKYARHTPAKSDGEAALRIAEQFIMTTLSMGGAGRGPGAQVAGAAPQEASHAL